MSGYREVDYTDELLADGSVHRRFSDMREEWRSRSPDRVVHWRDNRGLQGTDELLGNCILKRLYPNGHADYGREVGYGRTVWGEDTSTRNRTTFGGPMGAILLTVGSRAVLGANLAPPMFMSPDDEDRLREQARQQAQSSSQSSANCDDDWDDHTRPRDSDNDCDDHPHPRTRYHDSDDFG